MNEEQKLAKVLVNGKLFQVPMVLLDDGSLVPSVEIQVLDDSVKPKYVPGNFPWQSPNVPT